MVETVVAVVFVVPVNVADVVVLYNKRFELLLVW